ncbi:MAG TPA: ATP-binding protein [Fimbriimonadaceae bacterium]|nr:ATP-binding protein [Fimbriimonadaceae bacterium]
MSRATQSPQQPSLWKDVEADWTIKDIGAPLLASLAEGLYDAHEVLREYVQNAIDSYVDFRKLTGRDPQNTVQIFVDEDVAQVRIYDRGVGMDKAAIRQAKSIAVSNKLGRQNDFVGFRGIGIWSGLSVCDRLIVRTSKVGVPALYRLTIDFKAVRDHVYEPIPVDELLQGKFSIQEQEHDIEDHFTEVTLVNIDTHRYGALLDVASIERFAQQMLPVPFDAKWNQTEAVVEKLSSIPWTTTYDLTINGNPALRKFPYDQLKPPQIELINDDDGRQVAVAWVAETNRTGTKKAIDVNHDAGEVSNFAVRVKNFAVGPRGLYSNHPDVLDRDNLSWYVGEIYITEPEIKPDTNRRSFQRSFRSDAVEKALRKFYSRIATGARGWSEEVSAMSLAESVSQLCEQVQEGIRSGDKDVNEKFAKVVSAKSTLEGYQNEAAKADQEKDSDRVLAIRRYLRKPSVKTAIDKGLGTIAALEQSIAKLPQTSQPSTPAKDKPKRQSKARTAKSGGEKISTSDALGTQATTGDQSVLSSGSGAAQTISLDVAIQAFLDAVAAVVGTSSETYKLIDQKLGEELKRRGFQV